MNKEHEVAEKLLREAIAGKPLPLLDYELIQRYIHGDKYKPLIPEENNDYSKGHCDGYNHGYIHAQAHAERMSKGNIVINIEKLIENFQVISKGEPLELSELKEQTKKAITSALQETISKLPVLPAENITPSIEDTRFTPVVAMQDNDSQWYVIPANLQSEFNDLLEKGEHDEYESFNDEFSDYMTGGDLNLTQLYMKVETLSDAITADENACYACNFEEHNTKKAREPHTCNKPENSALYTPNEVIGMIPNLEKGMHPITDQKLMPHTPLDNSPAILGGPMFPRFLDHTDITFMNLAAMAPIRGEILLRRLNAGDKLNELEQEQLRQYLNEQVLKSQSNPKEKSALEMVEEFHQAFDCPVLTTPGIPDTMVASHLFFIVRLKEILATIKKLPDSSRSALRMKLILEEFIELYEATMQGDIIKALDGLSDLLYVTYGTHHEFGLGSIAKEAFREVHRSNMSKLGADGKPVYREDGKVLKGPNFSPPDLESIIKGPINATILNASPYPEWNMKTWREAMEQASKKGYADKFVIPDLGFIKYEHNALTEALRLGLSASLGANMPDIPGMPEPTSDGVILSDLKVAEVTQSDDGSINVEITGTKLTPVESIRATVEFKQAIGEDLFAPGSPELEAAKNIENEPPTLDELAG